MADGIDNTQISEFLRNNILRYSDIYFLQFADSKKTGDLQHDLQVVLKGAYRRENIELDLQKAWLIGTCECHLCEQALMDYNTANQVRKLWQIQLLDVLDFESTLMALIAPNIPVLITPKKSLVYPFGLMDIMALPTTD